MLGSRKALQRRSWRNVAVPLLAGHEKCHVVQTNLRDVAPQHQPSAVSSRPLWHEGLEFSDCCRILKVPFHVVQHQPSIVPSRPLGAFSKEPVKQEAPMAAAEPAKYNQMAPPMTAYTTEYALAKASAAMDGSRQQVHNAL